MNIIMIIILIAIILIGILIISYIYNFNNLQEKNIKINESESIIDNELRNKYDLVMKSSTTINKLLKLYI